MDSTKVCVNGHRYRSDLPECPFCPKTDPNARTVVDDPAYAPSGPSAPSVNSDGQRTKVDGSAPSSHALADKGARRTAIASNERGDFSTPAPSAGGRLVGWLVTFTWNPLGEDFQLREGKTRIGTTQGLDIVLPDPMVSSEHAQLLYRNSELRIRDNFSTNGTIVNGEDTGEAPVLLKDGDEITIGKTVFKLRLI